jgi:hypothetical protein
MRFNESQITSLIEAEYGALNESRPVLETAYNDLPFSTQEALSFCEELLAEKGIEIGAAYADLGYDGRLVLMVEAVNLAAKELDQRFYAIKPLLVELAAAPENNIRVWSGVDAVGEAVYYLYHRTAGTVSVHDPNGQISPEVDNSGWSFGWSGIYRQDLAFDLMQDTNLLHEMAQATRPRNFYN